MEDKIFEGQFEEKLSIRNFFSIINFDWDIENFNVLIGPTACGKSIAMKLLYFFEKAPFFLEEAKREKKDISSALNEKFNEIFFIKKDSEKKTCISENIQLNYSFGIKDSKEGSIFKLKASWDKEKENIKWEPSINLENNELTNFFPLNPVFIPACRTLASVKPLDENVSYIQKDYFLKRFLDYKKKFLSKFNGLERSSNKSLDKIKKDLEDILDICNVEKNGEELIFRNKSDIERTSDNLASGQAENLYLLPLICDMDYIKEKPLTSLFIEEPDAHLFPDNQLQVIKFLFEELNKVRKTKKESAFFISTHSTYILDRICTVLLNDRAVKKGKEHLNELPCFSMNDVAVYVFKTNNNKETSFVEKLEIHENGYFIVDPMMTTVNKMSEDNKKLFENIGA